MIIGVITDIGKEKVIEASNNLGFTILPTGFSVSNVSSAANIEDLRPLTAANGGEWYSSTISSREVEDSNTIKFNCVIPPNEADNQVQEIYIFAKDINDDDFLLAVAKPSDPDLYVPSGSTTLRVSFKINNANVEELLVFNYTQASEIASHNVDPNAHPVLREAIKKAGIFEQLGQHEYVGQHYDEKAVLDVSVVDGDYVYRDTDNVYKKALADGTIKSKVAGIASVTNGSVYLSGAVAQNNGSVPGTMQYLSATTPGQATTENTGYPLGHSLDEFTVYLRVGYEEFDSLYHKFDTVVSDENGVNHYSTLADAVSNAPSSGWVRVDKLEELESLTPVIIDKPLNVYFRGMDTGLTKFNGQNEIQTVSYAATPDAGSYVLDFDGQKTNRLNFDIDAATLETELELLSNITSVSVTGNAASGFSIEFDGVDGNLNKPQIALGTFLGQNEIQRLSFDNDDFSSGSFELDYSGEVTSAIAFNSVLASSIQSALNSLPSLSGVVVTQDFGVPAGQTDFTIEFAGSDGLQPQVDLVVTNNSLEDSGNTPIVGTVTEDQVGILPDNTLEASSSSVSVLTSTTQEGKPVGSNTAIQLASDNVSIKGLGQISNFGTGIDFNSRSSVRVEMYFVGNVSGINSAGVDAIDFSTAGSVGLDDLITQISDNTSFRDLMVVSAQDTPDQTVSVSSATKTASDGTVYGMQIDQQVSNFSGATINFSTGVVTGDGDNFSPYTAVTPGNYYKYIIVGTINDKIEVILPVGEGATPNSAPVPPITGGKLRGIVTVKDNGAGDIEVINKSDILRFLDSGAFAKRVQVKSSLSLGGTSTYSTSPDFEFDPSNDVYDLEVDINGNRYKQVASSPNLLDNEYTKTSSTEIDFGDNVPAGATVNIRYVQSTIDNLAQSSTEAQKLVEVYESDATTDTVVFSTLNFAVDDNIHDIDVLVNGNEMELGVQYTKITNNSIQIIDPLYLDGGGNIHLDARVKAKSRLFSTGGGSGSTILEMSDEGTPLADPVSNIDVVGPGASLTQVSPGVAQLSVDPLVPQSVGTGESIIKSLSGLDAFLRTIRGINGINVTLSGDTNEILIGLTQSRYFNDYSTGHTGSLIPTPEVYNQGVKQLSVYRNGLKMIISDTYGGLVDRYVESGPNNIALALSAEAIDYFHFINEDVTPIYRTVIPGTGSTTITIPEHQTGTNRLKVYRNGLGLLTNVALGSAIERYSVTNSTTIELEVALGTSDFLIVEFAGTDYDFVEDKGNFVGNTLTISNNATVGDDKTWIYKNGLLLREDPTPTTDTYIQVDQNNFTLGVNANLTDRFTIIRKA